MKTILFLAFLMLLVLGCASTREAPVVHMECAALYLGTVKRMERVGMADTVVAFVSIKTTEEYGSDGLPFVSYAFTRLGNSVNYGGDADANGKFRMALPAGSYRLRVSYAGYHDLPSTQLELKEGEIWEIEAILVPDKPVTKHKKLSRRNG